MNWFQIAHAPTWFWLHALKPAAHSEASGYGLGFWQPANAPGPVSAGPYQGLEPGHWAWNNFNWFADGSFVRHMQWNCQALAVTEEQADQDLRILAFKRPDGKLTIVLSNRSFAPHTFHVATGLDGATFKGYRYTPMDAGNDCHGVELPALTGGTISPTLDDLSWEFLGATIMFTRTVRVIAVLAIFSAFWSGAIAENAAPPRKATPQRRPTPHRHRNRMHRCR